LLHSQVKLTSSHKTSSRSLLHALGIRTRVQVLQPCGAPLVSVTRPRALRQPCRAPRILVSGRTRSTSTLPRAATTRLRPHALYVDLAIRRDYSSPAARTIRRPRRAPRLLVSGCTRSISTSSCTTNIRLHSPGCSDLPRLHRASGCLGTSRGSSRGSSRRSSSTTPPHAGSSSTTSSSPCIRVPWHVVRLVTRLVAPLIVDYSGLVVDYFASAARSGASARRAARYAARHDARHRLLRLAQARRRLLRLRRASGCLSTSCGSSRGSSRRSSSTTPPRAGSSSSSTLPPPRVRVPRHVTRPVAPLVVDYSASHRLVVDYFVFVARPGATARHAARHVAHRRLLRAPRLRLAATLAPLQPHRARRLLFSRKHWLYFKYAARRHYVVFRSHRVDHSSRLVFQTRRERQSCPQQLVGINSD
jgi:hypothetical protein